MTNANNPPKPKKIATYHEAAVSAFSYLLRKNLKNGDVTLADERRLSKRPLRVDMIIIRKNRDAEIETKLGKIFRGHNIVEYKSPVDKPLSLQVFDKTVHGYAGIYASQNDVRLTDMSVTIVCFKKPAELFEILKKDFNYKVLRKSSGIYYISLKGIAAEKTLAIQVVASSELDDNELVLKALKNEIDRETAKKVSELPVDDEEHAVSLAPWWDVMLIKNTEILKEVDMDRRTKVLKKLSEQGYIADYDRERIQEWKQEGMQEGMQKGMQKLLSLWERGLSLPEAKKQLGLA